MAQKNIKGITIEIGGDTTKLDKAIQGSNSEIRSAQKELIEVEKLLKDNQDNTELQRQKQELLTKSIEETKKKLNILKDANEKVTESAGRYDDWKAKYDPIQKEIDETKRKLADLRDAQDSLKETEGIETEAYQALQEEIQETSKRLGELRKEARAVNDEFGHPVSPDQYNAFQREVIETEGHLRKLSEQINETADDAGKAGESMGAIDEGLSEIGNATKAGVVLELGEQFAQIGEQVKEAAGYLMELTSEYDEATGKAAAYFGETGEQAKETAAVVEKVWLSGVGDSMGQVSDAVITVKKNIKDLDQETLTNITQQAIKLDSLYGIDMNESLRGANSLMEQFGIDAQTAMDYIVAGTQNGLDKTNELGDNIAEYAGKFAQAGYSAEEYFQLMNNGLEGGAYNLDKVNDAINEVTTRLSDGTIEKNLSMFSPLTRDMFKAWQDGEATQKNVISTIVQDITYAKNEQEALTMAATAFGTMGEDFGTGFIESLNLFGHTYDDVAGRAGEFYEQVTTPQQELEASMRDLQLALLPLAQQLAELAQQILPPLLAVVTEVVSFLASNPTIANIAIAIGAVLAVLSSLMPVITAIMGIVMAFGSSVLLPAIGIIAGVVAAIAAIVAVITNWGAITEWLQDTITVVLETCGELWDSFCSNVLELAEKLKQKAVDIVTDLKNRTVELFRNLKDRTLEVVTNLKDRALEAVTNLKDKVVEAVEKLKSRASEIVTDLKNNVVDTVTHLKEEAEERFLNMKTKAVEIMTELKAGIGEKVTLVKETIMDGIGEAVDWIKGLPEEAVEWGKDMLSGFIEGIMSKIEDLKDAVSGVADSVSEFLHFTRPDKGPLREYEEWMPHMMQGLAKGIRDNKYLITDQIKALTEDMSVTMNTRVGGAGQVNVRVFNEMILDGTVISESVNDTLGVIL